MSSREQDTQVREQDIGAQRKDEVRAFATTKRGPQTPDFPEGWSATRTSSGRVSRLSFEPKTPIEFAEAKGMAEAANHSLMAG